MDISPLPPTAPPQLNNLREGVLLLKGLMNNLLTLPADKSLLVELIRHMPLPTAQQQLLVAQPTQKTPAQPSWQPLLGDLPLELLELKLPSGQKIWAATLRTWFETQLAQLAPKSRIEVKPTKDGQLTLLAPQRQEASAPQQTALGDLWRKSLPQAQSPKLLMQLMTPLVSPLAKLPIASHPLQPIQQFINRQQHSISTLLQTIKAPATEPQKTQLAETTQKLINQSGVLLEPKLRNLLELPPKALAASLNEITTYDFKAQILKALASINQLSPQTTPGEDEWPDNLWHLFLGNKEAAPSSPQKNSHWLLLETLLPSLQKTLAGIQLQQAHSLAEQAKTPGAIQFEIPLPSAEGWLTLAGQFIPQQQAAIDEDSAAEKNGRTPTATWRLFLEFNLPHNGLLAVQFLWQPGLLRGKVWANQPKLKHQLKDQLKQLKQALQAGGINAEQLSCSDEPLTKPSPPINHPLVDIQT